ncbi:NPCBM/NEW2 domain-containing protein, partial [Planctomycetota bacterium]
MAGYNAIGKNQLTGIGPEQKMQSVNIILFGVVVVSSVCTRAQALESIYLSDLDLTKVQQAWGTAQADTSVDGNPLTIGPRRFSRGVGTHAESVLWIRTEGRMHRLLTRIGIDNEVAPQSGSINFKVVTDAGTLYESGRMVTGTPARKVDLNLHDTQTLILIVEDGGDGINHDHANWADAQIFFTGATPIAMDPPQEKPIILTPPSPDTPRINGARALGVRPGHPLLYTVAATAKRPLTYQAENLPEGITLDPQTGRLTGKTHALGEHKIKLTVRNTLGHVNAPLKLVVGDKIALTPPMGWNSWNCWGCAVDAGKVLQAAHAMVNSGLIHYGWTYINIDDCWMRHPDSNAPAIAGPVRDENGLLRCNERFPDMPGLIEEIHSLGLKAGIYISPGPTTCQGYVGSYGYEMQDATQFAAWGFDYLKYDWCGYSSVETSRDQEALIKPYRRMQNCLARVDRDIVYSLCQYGWGEVWQWGESVGGNCWRTTGDIVDTWGSMSSIGFGQAPYSVYAKPGHWNDPDMLVLGQLGWGPHLRTSRLTPNEQYTHMSLWCLLSAPLLLGCDLTQLDAFTLNLLTNDEVLAVNQDPLGRQAQRITQKDTQETWAKPMADGSLAIGLFNRGEQGQAVTVSWDT